MADVITRFKLETTQYDSKLRDAAKELSNVSKEAMSAGKNFNDFTQKNVEAARAFGQTESGAKNTKDKMRDLVGAFNDAAKAYNNLTEDQKKSDFGKALSQSLTQLQARIKETKNELYGLDQSVSKGGGGLFGGGKMDGMLSVLGGNLMTKGVMMATSAVTSFVGEIQDAIKQGIELAKQGEGIRIAFERVGNGQILDGLREATHGTVTDLELMKAAVKFNDFKLPIEELGTMLAFAQQKAKDTGQSVDYMVDSIVTGLGRKSLMILDNLGLSASEIKDKMAETGDMTKAVGAIIREQMAKAGDYVETAADRAAQANVSLQNKMEELGRKFAPVEEASNQLWTSMKIGILDVVGGPLADLINRLTNAGRLQRELNNINSSTGTGQTHSQKTLGMLKHYRGDKQELYNRQVEKYLQLEADAWRRANNLRTQLNNLRKQQRENPIAGNLQPLINEATRQVEKAENTAKAWQSTRVEYQKGAQPILNPVKNTPSVTTPSTTTTKPSKVGTNNTVVESDADKAAKEVQQAEKNYANEINNAQLKLAEQIMTSSQYDQQVLNGQQKLADAYLSAYNATGDERYLESFRESAKHMKDLQAAIEENKAEQKASAEAARELEQAQKKLADAQLKLTEAQATGSSTAIYNAQKEVNKQQERVNRLQDPTIPASAQPTGIEALKQTIQAEIKFDQMNVDETTLHNLLQTALSNGLEGLTVDYGLLQEKISQGIDIPDSTWESLQNEINEKLTEAAIEPIKINFETGGLDKVKKDSDGASKSMQAAAQAASAVGSALQMIEDPSARVFGIIAQAIATVAQGFATATAVEGSKGVWAWIAAVAAGTATMISTISSIKSATAGNFAQGGIVPGNSYSGDNIRAYGLNSGELILSMAQQNTIADRLTSSPLEDLQLSATIDAEQIRLVLNNRGRRTGRGEYVQTKFG